MFSKLIPGSDQLFKFRTYEPEHDTDKTLKK